MTMAEAITLPDIYRKTETEIERDFFRLVKASPLAAAISGELYRKGMRPRNAQTEDIVVTFLSGEESQEQNGVINLNVYVPMIKIRNGSNLVPNIQRCGELERMIVDFVDGIQSNEYIYSLRSTPNTLDDPELIQQTTINTRVYYRRTTY
jgi:uncharacterized UPF0146 family protein